MLASGKAVVSFGVLCCALALGAQDAGDLGKEDARLNESYKQRMAQLQSDPAAQAALRSKERTWIKQRDQKCGKDTACLVQETKAQADYLAGEVSKNAQQGSSAVIPKDLLGKWTIRKFLPTQGVSCWDNKQTQALVDTTIEYRSDSFLWKDKQLQSQGAKSSDVTAEAFLRDHAASGGSVDFKQLGLTAASVKEITIQHPDASVFGPDDCCSGVPGEDVMVKDANTIIFGLCGTYYEAVRAK